MCAGLCASEYLCSLLCVCVCVSASLLLSHSHSTFLLHSPLSIQLCVFFGLCNWIHLSKLCECAHTFMCIGAHICKNVYRCHWEYI